MTGTTDVKRGAALPGVRLGQVSFVWRPWPVLVTVVLAAATFLVFCLSIAIGDFSIALPRVIATIFGRGERVDEFVIMDLRMPRALAGLVVGIALGVSGAITQSIARNPLASPDMIGLTAGASAAAVFVIVVGGGFGAVGGFLASAGLPMAALIGGLLTAALIYGLAWRRGVHGFRLVLVGIGLQAMLLAIVHWLLVVAEVFEAARAYVWL
ncbi:MAG: FecCD family ABC transporter permease, partial [Spirillospora sp.]